MDQVRGIKIVAPVFDLSGYAEWSRNYVLALHAAGIPVTIFPVKMDKVSPDLGEAGEILKGLVSKDIDYNVIISWNVPPITAKVFEQEKESVLKVGFTLWETDKLPDGWAEIINNNMDECWLPGKFNKTVFSKSGVTIPIKLISYPLDFSKYSDALPIKLKKADQTTIPDDTYIFYYVSQWSERKNFADLLQAYWSEFTDEDKVCLVLKTHLSGAADDSVKLTNIIQQLRQLGNYDHDPEVVLITQSLPRNKMYGLHKRCNCYVSPSRGEGLGLGILEAGILCNPVISNLFGEQSEYIKATTSYLYNHSLRPVVNMPWSTWYSASQYWAQPDIKELAESMRYCYEHQQEAKRTGVRFSQELKKRCTFGSVAKEILDTLNTSLTG